MKRITEIITPEKAKELLNTYSKGYKVNCLKVEDGERWGGNVTDDGGGVITARGVCWNTTANPTTGSSHSHDGTGEGVFSSTLTGLLPSTTYHVRAYVTNGSGTSYGSDITFDTPAFSYVIDGTGKFVIDGTGKKVIR